MSKKSRQFVSDSRLVSRTKTVVDRKFDLEFRLKGTRPKELTLTDRVTGKYIRFAADGSIVGSDIDLDSKGNLTKADLGLSLLDVCHCLFQGWSEASGICELSEADKLELFGIEEWTL